MTFALWMLAIAMLIMLLGIIFLARWACEIEKRQRQMGKALKERWHDCRILDDRISDIEMAEMRRLRTPQPDKPPEPPTETRRERFRHEQRQQSD